MHGIFLSACIPQRGNSAIRPLGPYQIAWYLREHGYNIQVIDFVWALTNVEIIELVGKFITPETKFIGLGFMFDYKHTHLNQIRKKFGDFMTWLKKQHPTIKFIVGGPTTNLWSSRFQNGSLFDYYIEGYGEDQTLALFDHIYKGTTAPPFYILNGNKHIYEHLVPEKLKIFDFQHSRHSWHKNDCIQPGESLPIEVARGCIFKCSFCRYPHIGKHKNDYTRSVECLKEELIHNYENFKVNKYYITDDTFNADHDFIVEFTAMVKTLPFKIHYAAYIRADLLHAHPEQEDMFLENGLAAAFFGIESFHDDDAKMVGKPWSTKHGKEYISYLHNEKWQKKILITLGMIAGLPSQNLDELRQTNTWAAEHNIPLIAWHPLSVIRSTSYEKSEFDRNAEKYGFKFRLEDGIMIWYTDKCDANIAYDWMQTLQNEYKPYMHISSWTLMELATHGFDLDFLIQTKSHELPWDEITKRYEQFLANYFKDIRGL